jgi:4-hydroxyphenylpyruvate dioxygenase
LRRQHVEAYDGGAESLGRKLRQQGIGLTDCQVLLDFDAAPDALRQSKRAEAIRMLKTAVQVEATMVLAPAYTRPDCVVDRIDDDLRWLAREAASRHLRIPYDGMAWSTANFTLAAARERVKRLGEPNLDVVVDAFHILVRGRSR